MINCCVGSGDLGVSNIGERPSDSPRAMLCRRASSTESRNGSGATVNPSRGELRARPPILAERCRRGFFPMPSMIGHAFGDKPLMMDVRQSGSGLTFARSSEANGAVDGSLIGQYARPTHAIRPPGELRFDVSAAKVHAPLAVISFAISFAALSASSMPFAMEKITSCSVSFAPPRPPSGPRSDRRVNVTLDSLR